MILRSEFNVPMRNESPRRITNVPKAFTLVVLLVVIAIIGCCGGPTVVETDLPEAQARLMAINFAYTQFLEQRGRPPRNEKELRQTLNEENPEEALRSPRDGKPFVICYGVDKFGPLEWAKTTPVLAYEQRGDGSRWVLTVPGAIYLLDEKDFQQADFPPGHKVK